VCVGEKSAIDLVIIKRRGKHVGVSFSLKTAYCVWNIKKKNAQLFFIDEYAYRSTVRTNRRRNARPRWWRLRIRRSPTRPCTKTRPRKHVVFVKSIIVLDSFPIYKRMTWNDAFRIVFRSDLLKTTVSCVHLNRRERTLFFVFFFCYVSDDFALRRILCSFRFNTKNRLKWLKNDSIVFYRFVSKFTPLRVITGFRRVLNVGTTRDTCRRVSQRFVTHRRRHVMITTERVE